MYAMSDEFVNRPGIFPLVAQQASNNPVPRAHPTPLAQQDEARNQRATQEGLGLGIFPDPESENPNFPNPIPKISNPKISINFSGSYSGVLKLFREIRECSVESRKSRISRKNKKPKAQVQNASLFQPSRSPCTLCPANS